MSTTPIRLVLVDDHALFRAGVRAELTELADRSTDGTDRTALPVVEIVGQAADCTEAIEVIRATRPDVVLLDVHLPAGRTPTGRSSSRDQSSIRQPSIKQPALDRLGGGHSVIAALADDALTTRYLALSVSDAAEDVIAVVRAGARGYVTKTITVEELLDAIVRVDEGDAVFSPRLAGFVLDAFSGDLPARSDPDLDQLTAREQEVMRLIARGYTYREIGERLHLSVKTIETHVSAVLRKLQLSNRHQLTAWVNERRIL